MRSPSFDLLPSLPSPFPPSLLSTSWAPDRIPFINPPPNSFIFPSDSRSFSPSDEVHQTLPRRRSASSWRHDVDLVEERESPSPRRFEPSLPGMELRGTHFSSSAGRGGSSTTSVYQRSRDGRRRSSLWVSELSPTSFFPSPLLHSRVFPPFPLLILLGMMS